MLTTRIVLGAVVLFAMVRFFMSPTWPCAFVVVAALVVAIGWEALTVVRRDRLLVDLLNDVSDLKTANKAQAEVEMRLSDRVGALERSRALGGL